MKHTTHMQYQLRITFLFCNPPHPYPLSKFYDCKSRDIFISVPGKSKLNMTLVQEIILRFKNAQYTDMGMRQVDNALNRVTIKNSTCISNMFSGGSKLKGGGYGSDVLVGKSL